MKLRNKLFFAILSITIVAVGLICVSSYYFAKRYIVRTTTEEMEIIANSKSKRVRSFLNEVKSDIRIAQDYYNIKKNLPTLNQNILHQESTEFRHAGDILDSQLSTLKKIRGIDDIILISPKGVIVYTVNKAHGENLIGKPLMGLWDDAFKEGCIDIYFSDIFIDDFFNRSNYKLLVTAPIFDVKGKFAGVIGFETNMSPMYDVIEDRVGLGQTGESLLGHKKGNSIEFLHNLRHSQTNNITYSDNIALPIREATQGRSGSGLTTDYRAEPIVAAWRTIYVQNRSWGLVAKIDQKEALKPLIEFQKIILALFILIIAIVAVSASAISSQITHPILELIDQSFKVSKGDFTERVQILSQDEIGDLAKTFNTMTENLQKTTVSQDVLEKEVEQRKKNENELTKRSQLESRTMALHDSMKGEPELDALGSILLNFLSKKLNAGIGSFFVTSECKTSLKLVSSYAYAIKQDTAVDYRFGEGLVGQSAVNKKPALIKEVPEDYIKIKSSLGDTIPANILIAPILYENETIAVIELAALDLLDEHLMDFIEKVNENIGIVINSAINRRRMHDLLEESQRQAEELQEQQEKLKSANEELEEQAITLIQSEKQLKIQSENLKAINEELEEKTLELNNEKSFVEAKNSEIESKAKDLELANQYKSEFLANMSHELRTPLNSLLILAQTLFENEEKNLTGDQIESARIIYSGGKDLLNLINSILDLSKVEAGMLELVIEEVVFEKLIKNLNDQIHPLFENKNIEFIIEKSKSLPLSIQSDEKRLEQILKNLLSNAIKFTDKGSVTLKFYQAAPNTTFNNSIFGDQNVLAMSVTDTGIGISASQKNTIFEAFQQGDGSTNRKYGGTGLGLSISQELAKLLNGEIQLESKEGQGSKFTLFLPIVSNIAVTNDSFAEDLKNIGSETVNLPSAFIKDHRFGDTDLTPPTKIFLPDDRKDINEEDQVILIIEDDLDFAKILLDTGRKKGYKCIVTDEGISGICIALERTPNAIILDLNLPDINGLKVLEQLKYDLKTRHIPIHIISGKDNHIPSLQKGAFDYLRKPIEKNDLDNIFSKFSKQSDREHYKLLLIDDNTTSRKNLIKLLNRNDLKITVAENCKEGYQIIQREIYDCITVNINVFDIDGSCALENCDPMTLPPIILYSNRDLRKDEQEKWENYAKSLVIKEATSPERLIDEVTLFLHSVETSLPPGQKKAVRMLHDPDAILQDRNVLLVDDDARNTFALAQIFNKHNMNVTMADNGMLAIEKLQKQNNIDLLLIDIMMPDMDGYETIAEIRKMKQFDDLPIVALTAKAMPEDRAKCIKAGADDYISKPVNIDKLLSLMRVWLFNEKGLKQVS